MDSSLQDLIIIKNKKLTPREIDILACVVNNRGEKKVANILAISPRTVGTHIRNIMLKLECNSREALIDLIERANKLSLMRGHYIHLLNESLFLNQLSKISKLTEKCNISCNILTPILDDQQQKLLARIESDLNLVNIKIKPKNELESECEHVLYVNNEKNMNIKNDPFLWEIPKNTKIIILFFSLDLKSVNITHLDKENYISFASEQEYYFSIFALIGKITSKIPYKDEIASLCSEYSLIKNHALKEDDKPTNLPLEKLKENIPGNKIVKILSIIFVLSILLIIFFLKIKDNSKKSIRNLNTIEEFYARKNPLYHFIPEVRNKNFTAREKELKKISEILSSDHIVVIEAPPGYGKSALAFEYGYRQKELGSKVICFSGDDRNKINNAYREIAINLGVKFTLQDYTLIKTVNQLLGQLNNNVLLIFDNVENPLEIKDYILNLPLNVSVIVTSRVSNLTDKEINTISLMPFTSEEAIQYLVRATSRVITDTQCRKLLQKLVAEFEVSPYQLKKVVHHINSDSQRLYNMETVIDHFNFKELNEYFFKEINKNHVEWKILQYAAHLDLSFINITFLEKLMSLSKAEMELPMGRLKRLSLIKLVDNKIGQPGISMHMLDQNTIKEYIKHHPKESIPKKELYNNLIKVLDKIFPMLEYNKSNKEKLLIADDCSMQVVTVLNSLDNLQVDPTARESLVFKLARYYHYSEKSDYNLALKYYNHSLILRKNLYGDSNLKTAEVLESIGRVYENKGFLEQSIKHYKKSLNIKKNIFAKQGLSDVNTAMSFADTLDMMCIILSKFDKQNSLQENENIDNKLDYCKQAYDIRRSIPNREFEVAMSLNNMALYHMNLGFIKESISYAKQALDIYRKISSEDEEILPYICSAIYIIAKAYHKLGDIITALEYYEEAVIRLKNLSLSVQRYQLLPILLDTSESYYEFGDKTKALDIQKQAYIWGGKILGFLHQDVQLLKKYILKSDPQFLDYIGNRTIIDNHGVSYLITFEIKKKIQAPILNKIHKLVIEDKLTDQRNNIKKYFSTSLLSNVIQKTPTNEELTIAHMLIFEAINLGIMNQPNIQKNFSWVKQFAKLYPNLIKDIVKTHPEYFVDRVIINELIKENILTKKDLKYFVSIHSK